MDAKRLTDAEIAELIEHSEIHRQRRLLTVNGEVLTTMRLSQFDRLLAELRERRAAEKRIGRECVSCGEDAGDNMLCERCWKKKVD